MSSQERSLRGDRYQSWKLCNHLVHHMSLDIALTARGVLLGRYGGVVVLLSGLLRVYRGK